MTRRALCGVLALLALPGRTTHAQITAAVPRPASQVNPFVGTGGDPDDGIDLFPSERGALLSEDTLLRRFRRYCTDLELSPGLDLHSLRRFVPA